MNRRNLEILKKEMKLKRNEKKEEKMKRKMDQEGGMYVTSSLGASSV